MPERSARFSRKIGPSMRGGFFLTLVCVIMFLVQVAMLASKESWWKQCEQVPCQAPPRQGKQENALDEFSFELCAGTRDDSQRAFDLMPPYVTQSIEQEWPCGPKEEPGACAERQCSLLVSSWSVRDVKDPYLVRQVCLRSLRLEDGTSIPFGELCCSACGGGLYADLEYLFNMWLLEGEKLGERQACGLFSCKQKFNPAKDFCHRRTRLAKASQAFAVMSTIILGLIGLYHGSEAITLQESKAKRMPLPRELEEFRRFVRRHAHWLHYTMAFFCFLGGIVMVAALSEKLCGARMTDYVETAFGVRLMWFQMALQTLLGTYYMFTVSGYAGLSKAAKAAPQQVPIGSIQEIPQDTDGPPGPQQSTPVPVVRMNSLSEEPCGGADEPPAVELRAVRMSPKDEEGHMEMEPELGTDEGGREPQQPSQAPPTLS